MAGMLADGQQLGEVKREGDPRALPVPPGATTARHRLLVHDGRQPGRRPERRRHRSVQVPFNDGRGGAAAPLAGAADPMFEEYYPAFSPDDQLVAYTRVHACGGAARRAGGGPIQGRQGRAPRRQRCTVSCTGKKSRHQQPLGQVGVVGARLGAVERCCWVLFSSNRADVAGAACAPRPGRRGEKPCSVAVS